MRRIPDALPFLSPGRHRRRRHGVCLMEFTSIIAGERFSDHPRCTDPALAAVARAVNDYSSDAARQPLAGLASDLSVACCTDASVGYAVARRCLLTALPHAHQPRRRVLVVGLLGLDRASREESRGWRPDLVDIDIDIDIDTVVVSNSRRRRDRLRQRLVRGRRPPVRGVPFLADRLDAPVQLEDRRFRGRPCPTLLVQGCRRRRRIAAPTKLLELGPDLRELRLDDLQPPPRRPLRHHVIRRRRRRTGRRRLCLQRRQLVDPTLRTMDEQPRRPAPDVLLRRRGFRHRRQQMGRLLDRPSHPVERRGRQPAHAQERPQPTWRLDRRRRRRVPTGQSHGQLQRRPQQLAQTARSRDAASSATSAGNSTTLPPEPHHRQATDSTRSSSTSSSSIVRSPPTVKWWNADVRRVDVTVNRVRLPQASQR